MNRTYRVLCVCMGNVCRSPTAEAVLRRLIQQHQLQGKIEVDSAGTHGYRVGEACDGRTQQRTRERGYDLSSMRARKIGWQDFDYFDLILAMDKGNLYNLRRIATEEQQGRIHLLMEFARNFVEEEVPDPLVTLGESFDHVLAMIEDACAGVIDHAESCLAGAEQQTGRPPASGETLAEGRPAQARSVDGGERPLDRIAPAGRPADQ